MADIKPAYPGRCKLLLITLLAACGSAICLAADDVAPVHPSIWRLEMSPYTHHLRYNQDHQQVWAIGLEQEAKDQTLLGLTAFSNSFGQPSAYAYYGHVFRHVWDQADPLYFKLTGGLVYGYKAPHDNILPINQNGFSPVIIPAMGWRVDQSLSLQMNVLGLAAVMFMLTFQL